MPGIPEGSRLSGGVWGFTVRKKMIADVTSFILLLGKQSLEGIISWKMPRNCLWAVHPKAAVSWMMWKRRACFSSSDSAVLQYPPYWQCSALVSVSPQPWTRAVSQLSWQHWVPLEHWCSGEANPQLSAVFVWLTKQFSMCKQESYRKKPQWKLCSALSGMNFPSLRNPSLWKQVG